MIIAESWAAGIGQFDQVKRMISAAPVFPKLRGGTEEDPRAFILNTNHLETRWSARKFATVMFLEK